MLQGVRYGAGTATSESIVMRALSGTARVVRAENRWGRLTEAPD